MLQKVAREGAMREENVEEEKEAAMKEESKGETEEDLIEKQRTPSLSKEARKKKEIKF